MIRLSLSQIQSSIGQDFLGIGTSQRRYSAFSRRKNEVVFFLLENGRYRPNKQISKEKK